MLSVFRNSNKVFKSFLQHKLYFNFVNPRKADVLTHRGELLPFTVNNVWDNPGARRFRKQLGRGRASGLGLTL